MATKRLQTVNSKVHTALQLKESITEPSNTSYYMFASRHVPYSEDSDVPSAYDLHDNEKIQNEVYKHMIFGKRIADSGVSLMIRRIEYEANTVYDMYDHEARNLYSLDFYATVNAGSFYHTYKCLYNNGGEPSTIAPDFSTIDPEDEIYITGDGYVWKYIYSVSSTVADRFGTSKFFPITPNTTVTATAVGGTIDAYDLTGRGFGYSNYLSGNFDSTDLRIGSDLIYNVSGNTSASAEDGFYTGCVLKITAGAGVGQYAIVTDYVVNTTHKVVTIDRTFSPRLSHTSEYELTPLVLVIGDGNQTSNAVARVTINSSSNTVDTIEVLNRGAGYITASATVVANAVVNVDTEAELRPIISPKNGHGSDAYTELGASRICFTSKFSNSESNTISTNNDFRHIGILKDPVFSDAVVSLEDQSGSFIVGEEILRVHPIQVHATNAAINTSISYLTAYEADFTNQFGVGEYIYIKSSTAQQLAIVNAVANSTQLQLRGTNGAFTCAAIQVFKVDVSYRSDDFNITSNAITGTFTVNTTSNGIVGSGTSFTTQLQSEAFIYVGTNSTGYGSVHRVVNVANTTFATIDPTPAYANASAKGIILNYTLTPNFAALTDTPSAVTTGIATSELRIAEIQGVLQTGDLLIGVDSGAAASIVTVERSGVAKGFDTFIQMNKYIGSITSGTFEADEVVYQGSLDENRKGYLHSVEGSAPPYTFYVSDQTGTISVGDTITGANSGAIALLTDKYSPELVMNSGKIMYIENLTPVVRANNQSEQIKLIFEY